MRAITTLVLAMALFACGGSSSEGLTDAGAADPLDAQTPDGGVVDGASMDASTGEVDAGDLGTFAPPDLGVLTFDDPGDVARLNVPGGHPFPGTVHTLDETGGRGGSRALRIRVDPEDAGTFERVLFSFERQRRIFARWWVRYEGTPSGNVKGVAFVDETNRSGMLAGGAPCWTFGGYEVGSSCVDTGLSYGAADPEQLAYCGIVPTCENVADGRWHSFEVDYDRDAEGWLEARIWCDGSAVVLPEGVACQWSRPMSPYEGENVFYAGGDRATNTPSTIRVRKTSSSDGLDGISFFEMMSGPESRATVWIDDVAVSTRRIGP